MCARVRVRVCVCACVCVSGSSGGCWQHQGSTKEVVTPEAGGQRALVVNIVFVVRDYSVQMERDVFLMRRYSIL